MGILNIDLVKPKKGNPMETIGRVEGLEVGSFGLGVWGAVFHWRDVAAKGDCRSLRCQSLKHLGGGGGGFAVLVGALGFLSWGCGLF